MASEVVAAALILSSLLVLTEGVCKTGDLTAEEQAVLDAHNELRAKHEDTEPLCYGESGEDVTFTAEVFARETASRDRAPEQSKGKSFGENFHGGEKNNGDYKISDAYVESTQYWYKHKEETPNDYKQVVWKNSKQLNCGFGKFEFTLDNVEVTVYAYKVVCQYYPPGNKQAGAENIGDEDENVGALSSARRGTLSLAVLFMLLAIFLH